MKAKAYISFLRLAVAALLCVGAMDAAAQPISNLVVTVGTTYTDVNSNNWSYVLVGSPEYQLLAGKQFAVFAKSGTPTAPGTYAQHGTMFQQTSASAINALLTTSVALGENVAVLTNALSTLLQNPGQSGPVTPGTVVLEAFQASLGNPDTAQMVGLLARQHPGLLLCLGQGFAEKITTATTYEVREINPATGQAAEVVGQVTIVPGSPTVLAAPGPPFQVMTNDPSDHLRIRLRWGTSDQYRRESLLSLGFDVWRIPYGQAVTEHYLTSPPTNAMQLTADPNIFQANPSPVMISQDFSTNSGTGGANDPADRTTYFFSDSNGHPIGPMPDFAHTVTNGVLSPRAIPAAYTNNPAFADGGQYYYFITARDILGRDGYVSPGALGIACRRFTPPTPTNVVVQNTYQVGTGSGGADQQFFTITWAQDLSTNDQVTEYRVYRWASATEPMTNDYMPDTNCIGTVPVIPNSPANSFQDNGPGAPLAAGLFNYWYTVRAVSVDSCPTCDPLYSPNSMPVWGVLRQRTGPGAGGGQLVGSCGTPVVSYSGYATNANAGTAASNQLDYLFICTRLDPGIAWVEFFATNESGQVDVLGPTYFPSGDNTLEVPFTPVYQGAGNVVTGVGCLVGTEYGLQSAVTPATLSGYPAATEQANISFEARQVMLTSLTANDPILVSATCYAPASATAYPDGTVRLAFPVATLPMMIEVQTNGAWSEIGVTTPDANGFYSLFYPECLLGPLPPFQGCAINLPGEGGCSQAVSAGGPNHPINPIHVIINNLPAGSKEFRLYRSVDNGTKTLIAQGAVATNDPTETIARDDDGMPPSVATLCYYVQFLDMHGNGGPMTLIDCKDVKPATLPQPVLAAPILFGDASNPQIILNWFCPTSGIARFEILVKRADGGSPVGVSGDGLTTFNGFSTTFTYAGLGFPKELIQFDAAVLTPLTSAGFGPGPQFSAPISVLTNVNYVVSVAAMDEQGNCGPASTCQKFLWGVTNSFTPVPWPARALPRVNGFDDIAPASGIIQPRVAAVLLTNAATLALDGNYPVGIRIGDLSPLSGYRSALTPNLGTTNFFSYELVYDPGTPRRPAAIDPNGLIFQRLSQHPSRKGNSLLPIVVYRQQVANAAYPKVSGTVTQVTPLIERLAYGQQSLTKGIITYTNTIYDRLIGGGVENSGGLTGEFLYLRDQQPALLGASYQYFVVHMNAQHEIEEIIPAGTVTLPAP